MKKQEYRPPTISSIAIGNGPHILGASQWERPYGDARQRTSDFEYDDEDEKSPWDMDAAEYLGFVRYTDAATFDDFEEKGY